MLKGRPHVSRRKLVLTTAISRTEHITQHMRNIYLTNEYMCYRKQSKVKSISIKIKENPSGVTHSMRRGCLQRAQKMSFMTLPSEFFLLLSLPLPGFPWISTSLPSLQMLPTLLSLSFQKQDFDFWAPGGDSAGRLSVLLSRNGCGPPHVPAQVSVSLEGHLLGSKLWSIQILFYVTSL